jgi:HAD superfamily hydrolase (TIGR01459 family)
MSAPASSEIARGTGFLGGLAPLAARYDGFLLDQWGVLHDGTSPYPDAVACLERLRATGKKVIVLSNSGRRGHENEGIMARLGFGRHLYDHLVSAGDDARDALLRREDRAHRSLGSRCFLMARPGEEHLADALGLEPAMDISTADFILNISMDSETQSVAGWSTVLERAAARNLPMVCGNPDRHRVHADGRLHEAPGQIAFVYEAMGGKVLYHGKPHTRIYRTCLDLLGLPPHRILAIGDSLQHDVAGAAGAGIDAAFIAGGIHRDDLRWLPDGGADAGECLALFARTGCHPRYCLPCFAWGDGPEANVSG